MSLRYEQYAALKRSRDFLRWIMTHRGRITKKELRDRAYRCLRHFPFLYESGQPMWSKDPFTKDVEDSN